MTTYHTYLKNLTAEKLEQEEAFLNSWLRGYENGTPDLDNGKERYTERLEAVRVEREGRE